MHCDCRSHRVDAKTVRNVPELQQRGTLDTIILYKTVSHLTCVIQSLKQHFTNERIIESVNEHVCISPPDCAKSYC